jgi:hypothetical protein
MFSKIEWFVIACIFAILCYFSYYNNTPKQVSVFLNSRGYTNVQVHDRTFHYLCLTRGTYINREFTATYKGNTVSGYVCVNLFMEHIELN